MRFSSLTPNPVAPSGMVALEDGFGVERIAEMVGAASIADAEAILQAAVNRAVARRQTPVTVGAEDVQRSVTLVNGAA